MVVMQIIDEFPSKRLARLVHDRLLRIDIVNEAWNSEETADLIQTCYNSGYKPLQNLALMLAEQLAEDLMHDTTEWAAADTAVRLLETMRDLPLDEQLLAAHLAREDAARRTIEQLANRGLGSTREVNISTLYEVLEYASEWDDPVAFAPHLLEVWESIELAEREDQHMIDLVEGLYGPAFAAPGLDDIAAMFSLLQSDPT
jgi:hypothetical protein